TELRRGCWWVSATRLALPRPDPWRTPRSVFRVNGSAGAGVDRPHPLRATRPRRPTSGSVRLPVYGENVNVPAASGLAFADRSTFQ
ncbi:MAG: hypothetical protein M3Q03_01020, partial [Chloroflexota bacterium]|nr:hypothetical protein [Chloroflexota bacterium]